MKCDKADEFRLNHLTFKSLSYGGLERWLGG